MGLTRRAILAAGAAEAATTAVPRLFAQQSGKTGTGKFYERGPVRIYYEEAGSGFPLLLLPGGGLNPPPPLPPPNPPPNPPPQPHRHHRRTTPHPRPAPSAPPTAPLHLPRPSAPYPHAHPRLLAPLP